MLAACKKVEKETEAKTREISKENLEIKENDTFTHTILSSNKLLLENSLENFLNDTSKKDSFLNKEDNWKDDLNSLPVCKS